MVIWRVLVPDVFRPLHFGVEVQTEEFYLLTHQLPQLNIIDGRCKKYERDHWWNDTSENWNTPKKKKGYLPPCLPQIQFTLD
jgi:hypothetical protein